jgi:hypothetical protein
MKILLMHAGRNSAAAAGGIMLVPAALLCFTGILLGFGISGPNDLLDRALSASVLARFLISPWVIMGGPALAMILNVIGVAGVRAAWEPDGLYATLFVRKKPLNIAVAAAGAGLLCMLVLYMIGENFVISPR